MQGHIEQVSALTQTEIEDLFRLMLDHYEGVDWTEFLDDLHRKTWILTLRQASGQIVGFSTQVLIPVEEAPDTLALFSGDTIVQADVRNSPLLAGLWGVLACELMKTYPDRKLIWYLISKGYKTYRFLPLFFHEFYPNRFRQPSPAISNLLKSIGTQVFGERFDRKAGIVRAKSNGCRLKPNVAPIEPGRLRNEDIRFFVERNPRHAYGDELCCLAPLTQGNLKEAAFRVIRMAERSKST